MISQFFCMLDSGTLLFHREYQPSDDTDVALRANLISAIYSFVTTVEHDSIDFIRMKKASVIFQKTKNVIFVLFLDSRIPPALCRDELKILQQKFFDCFPEILWNYEIINLTMFKPFKKEADLILLPLAEKLEFTALLFSDGLVDENDFLDNDFESLGSIAGSRFLEKSGEQISCMKSQENFLESIDDLLERFESAHIERQENTYYFDCKLCNMCFTEYKNCFFEGFITVILSAGNLEPNFPIQQETVVTH